MYFASLNAARTLMIVVVGIAWQHSAKAQAVYGTTLPSPSAVSQPRLSPYLDLLRTDNSVLTPYHSFVQPRQELRQNLRRQELQIGQLERTSLGFTTGTEIQASTRQPTGGGGNFNNYLHFYQFKRPLQSK